MYTIQQTDNNGIRFTDTESRMGSVTQPAIGAIVIKREQFGPLFQTTLTLDGVGQSIVNGTEYQSTLIYTFPEGRINVLGCTATLQQKTTSALASTLNASSTGAISLGTAAASSTTLATTMVDLLPSTAFTSSATVNVAGTSAAKAMYLNTAYATTTDVDANATQTISGTITLTFLWLGDY